MASPNESSTNAEQKSEFVRNKNLASLPNDFLYHINMGTHTHDLKALFQDTKFVCVGGSPSRMLKLAQYLSSELSEFMPPDLQLENLTGSTDRYVMYKAGPILTASHGVGVPSMSILLNEVLKMLHYAGATDVVFVRIGTSGGLGVEPGTVVVTTQPLNGELEPHHEQLILGKRVKFPASLSQSVIDEIVECGSGITDYSIIPGQTMCAHDFYEGQGRIDGCICDFGEEDKMAFLRRLHEAGVRNIEMECTAFAALTHRVNVKAAVVCVTLLNRLIDDQVKTEKSILKQFEMRPAEVISKLIRKKLTAN